MNGLLTNMDLFAAQSNPVSSVSGPAAEVAAMLQRYLKNPAASLITQLKVDSTEFQQRVWKRLQEISIEETRTYGQLAAALYSSSRVVGNACRRNPCPLVIPCHRVVSKSGLEGFSGQITGPKLEIKRRLLRHEGGL